MRRIQGEKSRLRSNDSSRRNALRVLGEFRRHRGVTNQTRNQAIDRALISIHERGIGALRARQRFADDLVVSHCLVSVTMLRLFMFTIC